MPTSPTPTATQWSSTRGVVIDRRADLSTAFNHASPAELSLRTGLRRPSVVLTGAECELTAFLPMSASSWATD